MMDTKEREPIPQDLLDAIDSYGIADDDEDIHAHRRRAVIFKLKEWQQSQSAELALTEQQLADAMGVINKQGHDLEAAQAKVAELEYQLSGIRICLQEIRNDHWTHWPDSDIQKVNKALASTDTGKGSTVSKEIDALIAYWQDFQKYLIPDDPRYDVVTATIVSLRQQQGQGEPFGRYCGMRSTPSGTREFWGYTYGTTGPVEQCDLFTRPFAARELSDEEIETIALDYATHTSYKSFARAVLAAAKEK